MAITVVDAGGEADETMQVRAKMQLWTLGDSGSRIAWVFPIGVVQNVEAFRPQLELVAETNGLPSTGAPMRPISNG